MIVPFLPRMLAGGSMVRGSVTAQAIPPSDGPTVADGTAVEVGAGRDGDSDGELAEAEGLGVRGSPQAATRSSATNATSHAFTR
jgi:hypothetical protein